MLGSSSSRTDRSSRFTLRLESLEDRIVPSWDTVPPASITPPSQFDTVNLNSVGAAAGFASITNDEIDWYRFTAAAGAYNFAALTPFSRLDTVLGVYTSSGNRVAFNDDISDNNRDSQARVTLPRGDYFLGVTNYIGAGSGSYFWQIEGPDQPTDDRFEENDTFATAANLGSIDTLRTEANLIMADSNDYFRFSTTATGTSSDFVRIDFQHAEGDLDLELFNANGQLLAFSDSTSNSETLSLAGRPAGDYIIRVYGFNGVFNPEYTLSVDGPGDSPPPNTSNFQIDLRITGMTASQQQVFVQAADRWEQIIIGDVPDATYNGTFVDDILIDGSAQPIDGPGGTLGQAGPTNLRPGSLLPIRGIMEFDTADLNQLEANGSLFDVIVHEMGHVLGIGTIWQGLGLLQGAGGSNPRFTGTQATAQYNSIFGNTETSVPVENTGGQGTRDGHWRESIFGNELMTGFLNSGVNPLSRVTVGALADMGYVVNLAAADNYSPPGGGNLIGPGGRGGIGIVGDSSDAGDFSGGAPGMMGFRMPASNRLPLPVNLGTDFMSDEPVIENDAEEFVTLVPVHETEWEPPLNDEPIEYAAELPIMEPMIFTGVMIDELMV